MLDFFIELIGTVILLSVFIQRGTMGQFAPSAIALSVTSVIYFGVRISGGHFNPAVTTVVWMNKNISTTKLISHIIAQLFGVSLAFFFSKIIKK